LPFCRVLGIMKEYNNFGAKGNTLMEESQDVVGQEGNSQPVQQDAVHPMTELLDTSFQYRELHHGDVVEGTIVHVSSAEVLIDIGSKSEGVLAGRERERMGPEAASELQVGQKVLVYVLNPEDKNGNVRSLTSRSSKSIASGIVSSSLRERQPVKHVKNRERSSLPALSKAHASMEG
jgi:small subunit ribosomal protein S1